MKRTDENHSFNIHVCKILGNHVQKAILLKEIYGWIMINLKKKHNLKHGLIWTYMSAQQFSEKFPYMASKSIDRWLRQLQSDGWLFVGNFNEKSYDKTKWYTINWKRYDLAVLGQKQDPPQNEEWIAQIEECIAQNEETITQIEQSMYQTEEPIPSPTQSPKTSTTHNNGDKSPESADLEKKKLEEERDQLKKELEELKKKKIAQKKKKFIAPTLQELEIYCDEQKVKREFAASFFDHYSNTGWRLGKGGKGNVMKDWKAAFRTSMRQEWNQKYKLTVPTTNGKRFTHANYEKYLK